MPEVRLRGICGVGVGDCRIKIFPPLLSTQYAGNDTKVTLQIQAFCLKIET